MEPAGPHIDTNGLPRLADTPVQGPRITAPRTVVAPTVYIPPALGVRTRKRHPVAITFLTVILMAGSGVGAWFVARKEPPKVQYSLEVAVANAEDVERVEFIERSAEAIGTPGDLYRIDVTSRLMEVPQSNVSLGEFRAMIDLNNGDLFISSEEFAVPMPVDTPWMVIRGDGTPVDDSVLGLVHINDSLPPLARAERVGEERVGDYNCVRWSLLDDRVTIDNGPPLLINFWVDKNNHIRKLTLTDRLETGDVLKWEYTYTKYDDEAEPLARPTGAQVTDISAFFRRS